ncbi:TRAG protein [Xaviernesmea oryzae]|uniref:TRAG protein n=1 Tax=Xaviernesmea oryzae TaxID=464029 RepID=A0A1Q9AVZ3_9HYPH|nr:type IV secretory system conjugative DNA transfer family protein [Xaviernesmea oryzae]OLP59650.1 TRAG protein [Xaviernesmea oryzae]SEM24035.1 type IV secretion system protein VirD4 [Xaviernesmea oryzae]
MKRFEKIALICLGPFLALAALFFAWSADYAAASFITTKNAAIWRSFTSTDLLMPVKQAWFYASNPQVRRLILIASAATGAEAMVVTGGTLLLAFRPWEVRPPRGGSRLATRKDLQEAGLIGGEPGKSILLGTLGEGRGAVDVRYSGDSHFYVNGPSRSGKGRGFVMTNLVEFSGSVVVLDVKLENFALTGAARLAMGQKCFVFAPGSAKSHRWNPLDFVRDWPERSTDLLNLATSFLPIGEKEDAYWKQTARGLMAAVLGYVTDSAMMNGRRNLRSVLRLFSTGERFSDLLKRILVEEPELDDFILAGFRQHLARDEEQRPSFEGHVITALAPFNNRLMAAACSASDFDLRDLRRRPFSLFIASPVSDFGTVEPLIRLLIQQIHDLMLRSLPGPAEPHRVLMMLDEFYQFERLPEIVKRAPLVAGYGLTIALIAQNIPQIDERYGQKTRDALIGNMDVKLFIGIGDETTARFVSMALGRKYEEREGWGRNRGVLGSKTASQGRFELVPLMDADAVQRLDDDKTILQVRSGYGAILNKLNFYTHDRFVARRRQVASFARELYVPEVFLEEEWPLFLERPAKPSERQPALGAVSDTTLDHDRLVSQRARAVFADPAPLLHAYRTALEAVEDRPAADLLFRLRADPETLGTLHGGAKTRAERRARKIAREAIWPLREAIIAARWEAIRVRLDAASKDTTVFFSEGAVSASRSIGPTETADPEDEEDNRLELFFEDGTLALAQIGDLARQEIDADRVTDAAALSRALENVRAEFDRSLMDSAENLLPSEVVSA